MHKMKYFMECYVYLFVARKLDGSNLSKALEFPLTVGVVLQTKGHPNELGTPSVCCIIISNNTANAASNNLRLIKLLGFTHIKT